MATKPVTLDHLRRHAVARTLFTPTTLPAAIRQLGFVQADPIRAPARAQDLTLRHRVRDYRAGDLERRYPRLPIEEDALVNYGFLPREHLALMHPRTARRVWDGTQQRRAASVLAFIREHGPSHPREVQAAFEHGRTTNAWGGQSNEITHLLDGMHYRGLLRVARRDAGVRVYAVAAHADDGRSPAERAAALLALVLDKYAPLPARTLGQLVSHLGYGAPQLGAELRAALAHARASLPSATVDGVKWLWPDGERPQSARHEPADQVRLLAPFDPIVWDRLRFELLWGWAYRFEAYTPAPRRQWGYYALPLLWRDRVIGWANVSVRQGVLVPSFGYVESAPKDSGFAAALDEELQRMHHFLAREAQT
ncbi:DNA glycosylase AlkZ-like family protein [Aquincola sp. J276]|uniref:DNA glycosylase AlkZ-like family protein n=1 Tax=Aquincola sp. J276 TaxID=2898432 RepID=UPI0021515950|nr:crosslink repair DNA glycosylase YcaQ family protein [Aquincola sp. J276]MCR5866499.1 winged helix DNA-binding domain-containing protein [Aquincola sp. J276]